MPSIINATTTAGVAVTGDNSGALALQTNNGTTAVTIDTSQNVGIGTTTPAAKLQVQQTNAGGAVVGAILQNVGGSSNTAVSLDFAPHEDTTSPTTLARINAIRTASGSAPTDLVFSTYNSSLIERGRFDSSGNFRFNSGYGSVATAYGCRAWVNFNGTGTVAIRGSANISSITDRATGQYTLNFTTAMPDANYCGVGTVGGPTSADASTVRIPDDGNNLSTGSCPIGVAFPTVAYRDSDSVQVSIFR